MATHSSILAWKTPWTEEPGGLQCMGHKESDTTERLSTIVPFTHLKCTIQQFFVYSDKYNHNHNQF